MMGWDFSYKPWRSTKLKRALTPKLAEWDSILDQFEEMFHLPTNQ